MPSQRVRRGPRRLDAGPLTPFIDSFTLELRARGLAGRTVTMYREAVAWLAGEHLTTGGHPNEIDRTHGSGEQAFTFPAVTDWADIEREHVQSWITRLRDRGHGDAYVNNQFRCLRQFFIWLEDEEGVRNPLAAMKPPRVTEKPVPVFSEDEIGRLFAAVRGGDLWSRRDAAIMFVLRDTGVRLMELSALTVDDVDFLDREATVTGKGGRERTVKYTYEAARALDRYMRSRAKHRHGSLPPLWIGPKGALTASGIYQAVERRAAEAHVSGVHPHRFRHHFSHTWLDRGGAEGDLMELNGWTSPQMLRRYGRSAASARARRGYDRIMGDA
ncbi:tyrosine-type recombinase/integrase [Nocardiopsis sp. RSe5-2]|uniref:Tyrosine-type recombinase/integrase n=1 Tax=Nocardiopsis endophytica TaxID=3018445 RepID=A0ABT4U1J0_9ACTN|nr:tyrosine-type recombinase/integrase [Nocardiopsis endophytica]MDA2810796.1 tyrosine-type recombinase/integrase [Nocardiopsis endophytica]